MTTVKILILENILQGENDKEYYGSSILFHDSKQILNEYDLMHY